MKIALVQMPVGFDKDFNIQDACRRIRGASLAGAEMAVLPEMFCCPYATKYFRQYGEEEGGPAQRAISALARELEMVIVAGSIPELEGERVYNTSYVYGRDGRQLAKHRKVHLFDIDVKGGQRFRESDILTPGDAITTFETPWGTFGLCICFDFRFAEMAQIMALRGARMIVVPAAFNMTTGPAHWELMFRQRAVDCQLFTVGASCARDESFEYVAYGSSIAVSPWGEVLGRCAGDPCTMTMELRLEQVDEIRAQLPILSARRTDLYGVEERG